jgi:tRNA(Ile)-lysidine synthase
MRLRRLEPVLRRALRGPCRLPAGSTLLVAVSGGADSTALLVALASLAREFGITLHAAHLHHGLRGADADGDLAHVRALCEAHRVPLASARWDCRARMRRRALAGEAGLRTLRREFLVTAARRWRASAIATAHTADDQLETLLMRLARGTGLTGMGGMRARRGVWLKPLLECTRAEVERDLTQHAVAWREDTSNATPAYLRNRIRHAVVPALLDALGAAGAPPAQRRAGLARRAATLAHELAQVECTLARAAARALDRMRVGTVHGPALDARALAALPVALQRLALRRAWRRMGPVGVLKTAAPARPSGRPAPGLTAQHLGPLLDSLASRERRAETSLPAGWRAVRERGTLRFVPPERDRPARAERSQHVGPTDARVRAQSARPAIQPTARTSASRRS